MRYARDTVVAGQLAQLLTRSLLAYDAAYPGSAPYLIKMTSAVTRTVAARVEVWANGQFHTLYDFAAQPGSSWLTPRVVPSGPCPVELAQVTVDSVGTQQVAGRTLRWLRVHLTTPSGGGILGQWPGRIYEQAGSIGPYMQPQSPICGGTDPGYISGFKSFKANGWPNVGPSTTAIGTLLSSAQARATAAGFSAYPNPGAGLFTLALPAGLAPGTTLRLLDLSGRVLRQLPVPATGQLDARGLPAGCYTLLLEATGQPTLAQRLVVQ